jgi:hypothetical protein
MSLFLEIEEIERLTGCKRKAKQCEQLNKMNIPYRVNARGEPIVAAAYIIGITKETPKQSWQPNLKLCTL